MLTFTELLDYTERETARWEEWLRQTDFTVLELPIAAPPRESVRQLIAHIFIVEHRYADRLHGEEPVSYESFPDRTVEEVFAIHRSARPKLTRWVAQADEAQLAEELTFPTLSAGVFTASKRKIVAHALMHGIRHWAQIATVLRQAGHPQPWGHDLLFSDALR
jgi:uncharacterized damage-inducible protein DinB